MWMTEGFHRPTCLEQQGRVPGRQSPPGTSPVSKRSSVAWGHVSSGAQRGGQPPRGGAGGSRRASVLAATGRRIGALEGLDSGDNECCSATTNVAGIRRSPVGGPTPARPRVCKQDPHPCLESQKTRANTPSPPCTTSYISRSWLPKSGAQS